MSAFKGTPGPWALLVDGFICAKDGGRVADPSPWSPLHKRRSDEEVAANARLIAAAPELLEVAQRSADALRSAGIEPRATSDNPLEWLLHQTEAAIAKATGGDA